ncbi:thiamine pyrophosphate-dependent dehydrogenase E1 component subunit alpha (plasmid) [Rhodococcus sp. USK10]|uniref:thiamine pyrophosphate-dependent dehydrogenase E1 component subunit alpha n=1 Tax=Rhodococcus sp. USK10 TaxID=2789739 RepID=UPI001C5E8E30|nr:thiamine pyrophosphate-dependent dehydrogenase E1 component subunit alpha [Rhodococcus sp. USK10]QYB00189.1 thiamine pyrophosphate-dependent dehydrogenase E1 component subunit alpha [Rhodococcus sp. USK10]
MTATDTAASIDVARGLADLHQMWRMRALEEKIRELRMEGPAVGSIHLDIGQEAIPTGVASLLGEDDAVFATYRGHAWALGCGVPPERIIAEILGRATGINGGRGGSAYFTAPSYRFYGENSIVGAGAPIAVGAALAGSFDGTNRVAVTVFGDGAMNQGAVHEAMNFAAARRLPVIFICENNYWSELTAIKDVVGEPELFRRAAGYGIAGERINGNDPAEVRARVGQAFEIARSGGGPTLIEAMTARLVGHYVGDVEQYRRPGELDQAREEEPIAVLGARLRAAGAADEDIAGPESTARAEIDGAAQAALSAPLADPTTAKEHLYV